MDADLREILEKPFRTSTDSRTLEKSDVFFALKGPRYDGHDFIREAATKGAAWLVVSDPDRVPPALKKNLRVTTVDDTLRAYGDLARATRQKFKVPVVAVTGSCGKTTVKELIAHVLSKKFRVLKSRGTENNLVGVPKTLLQLDASVEVAVLELGTNRPGEIAALSSIATPQIAVITQIGSSHLEGLKSMESVKAEKLSILQSLERGGTILVNGQDPMLAGVKSGVHRVLKVGFQSSCDTAAEQIWCHEKGSSFTVEKNLMETPLLGRHNILNCLFAVVAARALGMGFSEIRMALADFRPPAGRLSLRETDGIRFLDDSYNANPTSFRVALETLKELKGRGKKGIVCGDMLELGPDEEKYHRELGAQMADQFPDFVIAVGSRCGALADEALKKGYDPQRMHAVKDSVEAGGILRQMVQPGDCVLVKGSRGMKMERIFQSFT